MIFHELKHFLTLAECLNFSVAAEKLYISQPGLSKMISGMESELGVKLFNRNTRKVELTAAGLRFYNLTKAYMEQCEMISAAQMSNALIGSLSVAFGNLTEPTHIPAILTSFRERHPSVTVTMEYMDTEQVKEGVRSCKIDIGILSSFSVYDSSEFGKLLLSRRDLHIAVWPEHPFASRDMVSIGELRNEKFILINPAINNGADVFLSLCASEGFVPNVEKYVESFHVLFMLIAQKQGISFNLTNPHYEKLIPVRLDVSNHPDIQENSGIMMIWNRKSENPSIKAFLKIVKEHLESSSDYFL
ncbi:MAG: LysR family transcriptional regulator [Butyricicoccus sp.]|nr:LysR family transcriptional regulator [Butyricicoccus sp.]